MRSTLALGLILLCFARPAIAQEPVAVVANLALHSSFWINLHHTLFAAAWARRPQTDARRLVGPLPAPLTASLSEKESADWNAAIAYYDAHVADRDLRTGRGMTAIKVALASGDLGAAAIERDLRTQLESAAAVYRRHFWPAHDADNRRWIRSTADMLRSVERDVISSHERLYGRSWFSSPVRVDVVWIGRAYTTIDPYTHATVSPAEISTLAPWTAVEMTLHEVAHELILPTERLLREAFDEKKVSSQHYGLWHPVQFYVTGSMLQHLLRKRGVAYTPYLYSTGLLDRAWGMYRPVLEEHWEPFVRGEISRSEAIARSASALSAR
jgi:hypothetical protein